jgi:hypothetical protein
MTYTITYKNGLAQRVTSDVFARMTSPQMIQLHNPLITVSGNTKNADFSKKVSNLYDFLGKEAVGSVSIHDEQGEVQDDGQTDDEWVEGMLKLVGHTPERESMGLPLNEDIRELHASEQSDTEWVKQMMRLAGQPAPYE